MSDEDFDWDADDFDPEAGFTKEGGDDAWAGEDEGLDTEALKQPEVPEEKPKPKKPSKEERIAEKKAKRRAEDKAPEVVSKPLTATEELEEKLTQQRLQEESDLAVAMETFSVKHKLIDTMEPKSEEEFAEFQEALTAKISKFEASPYYVKLLEKLIISTCKDLDIEDLRHLSTTLSTMASEKQKAKAPKVSKKKQVKASLGQVGKAAKKMNVGYDDDDDLGADFDDFM